MMIVVYQATNKVNGKRYIGVTKKNLEHRIQDHFYRARTNPSCRKFHAALNKYGRDAFEYMEAA